MNEPFKDSVSQTADADRRSELRTGWSRTDSPHSVAAALKLVNDFLLQDEGGTSIQWINAQAKSPDKFTDSSLLEEVGRIKEWITSRMGQGPQGIREVNQFLKDGGFAIQLDENVPDTDFGVAAIFAYTDGWAEHHQVGERGSLSVSDDSGQRKDVPAIIASGADILQTTHENRKLNMYRLLTESQENDISEAGANDGVYFVQIDQPNEDLYTIASELFANSRRSTGSAMLHLPTVDLRASGTINELVGATAVIDGRQTENRINQALFEHILQYNKYGFSAKSAAAVEASRSGGHGEKVEFDRPFLLFLVNKGVISSAGYVTLDDMKVPDIVDLKPRTQSSSDLLL